MREGAVLLERVEPAADEPPDLIALVVARQQRLDVREERRHALADVGRGVGGEAVGKIFRVAREIEGQPPAKARKRGAEE
eukprot:4490508-Pleurochrysis_carterae.AAC.2